MAVHAWLVDAANDRRLIFSEATILPIGAAIEVHTRSPLISFTGISKAAEGHSIAIKQRPAIQEQHHGSMSTHRIQLPEVRRVFLVQKSLTDERLRSCRKSQITLPAGVNYDLVEADYVGDVGMTCIEGQLVDDHFYYGQPS